MTEKPRFLKRASTEEIAPDLKAFEELMAGLVGELSRHFGSEVSQKSACEALSALACATAQVVGSAGDSDSRELAIEFFNNALSSQLKTHITGEQHSEY